MSEKPLLNTKHEQEPTAPPTASVIGYYALEYREKLDNPLQNPRLIAEFLGRPCNLDTVSQLFDQGSTAVGDISGFTSQQRMDIITIGRNANKKGEEFGSIPWSMTEKKAVEQAVINMRSAVWRTLPIQQPDAAVRFSQNFRDLLARGVGGTEQVQSYLQHQTNRNERSIDQLLQQPGDAVCTVCVKTTLMITLHQELGLHARCRMEAGKENVV